MISPHGESAESSHRNATAADLDPAHLIPPADPWLAEASTSVLGGATPSEVPPDDTTPFAAPPFQGDAPPRRRAIRWVVAVLAACALFIAGMLAIDQFGDDDDVRDSDPSIGPIAAPTPAGTGPERPTTVTTSTQPANAAPEVVYEVTASGSRNTGSVSYTDQDGDIIRRNGIPLPWRTTFPVGAQRRPLVLDAQRKGGGNAGPVTCTITVSGKLLASTTAEGRYAATLCSGSG